MKVSEFWGKKGLRQFLLRTGMFALAFILVSFLIGSIIVTRRNVLLKDMHFEIYGGFGYILLAMTIFFVVFSRAKLLALKETPAASKLWLVLSAGLVYAFIYFGGKFNADPTLLAQNPVLYIAGMHALFLSMLITLALGFYSFAFIKYFVKTFRRELIWCAVVGLVFYASMRLVWKAWPALSWGVSRIVYGMFELVYPNQTHLIPPMTLSVKGFTVYIGEACSGVYSIFIFTSLYLLLVALDWKILNHTKAVAMFFVALAGLYLTNVLRVFLILLVGIWYDKDFAVNLFHSYIGMLLFMAFFIAFLWLTYDWMKIKKVKA